MASMSLASKKVVYELGYYSIPTLYICSTPSQFIGLASQASLKVNLLCKIMMPLPNAMFILW